MRIDCLFKHCGVILGLVLIIVSCASAPKIHSVYIEGTDFQQYKTYAFLDKLEPKGQQYSTIAGKYIREAVARELERRGMTAQAENPDVLVGFNVHRKEKIETRQYPSAAGHYYHYRGAHGYSYGAGFGTETRVTQYTEGTLNIDVVDRAQKQLIWEGVAVGRIKRKPPENAQEVINEVVGLVFEEYPILAEGAQ